MIKSQSTFAKIAKETGKEIAYRQIGKNEVMYIGKTAMAFRVVLGTDRNLNGYNTDPKTWSRYASYIYIRNCVQHDRPDLGMINVNAITSYGEKKFVLWDELAYDYLPGKYYYIRCNGVAWGKRERVIDKSDPLSVCRHGFTGRWYDGRCVHDIVKRLQKRYGKTAFIEEIIVTQEEIDTALESATQYDKAHVDRADRDWNGREQLERLEREQSERRKTKNKRGKYKKHRKEEEHDE